MLIPIRIKKKHRFPDKKHRYPDKKHSDRTNWIFRTKNGLNALCKRLIRIFLKRVGKIEKRKAIKKLLFAEENSVKSENISWKPLLKVNRYATRSSSADFSISTGFLSLNKQRKQERIVASESKKEVGSHGNC